MAVLKYKDPITGEIKKVGSSSIGEVVITEHVNNNNNPHMVTIEQIGAAPAAHSHNDLYYTESEINSKLEGKSNTGHNHNDLYYTKAEIDAKNNTSNTYADQAAQNVKNDLLNGAGAAYDTLKELGDLINENVSAIDALETVAAKKADLDENGKIPVSQVPFISSFSVGGSQPTNTNLVWIDTNANTLKYWNGAEWKALGAVYS